MTPLTSTMTNEQGSSSLAALLQRAIAFFRGGVAVARRMRHVETLPLGGKRALLLVECDGVRFLIAAGGDSVSAPVPLHGADAAPEHERAL